MNGWYESNGRYHPGKGSRKMVVIDLDAQGENQF